MLSSASLYAHRHIKRELQGILKYWWGIYFLWNIVYIFSKVTWNMFQVTLDFFRKFYTVWITDQNAVFLECNWSVRILLSNIFVKTLLYRWCDLPQRPWKSYPRIIADRRSQKLRQLKVWLSQWDVFPRIFAWYSFTCFTYSKTLKAYVLKFRTSHGSVTRL